MEQRIFRGHHLDSMYGDEYRNPQDFSYNCRETAEDIWGVDVNDVGSQFNKQLEHGKEGKVLIDSVYGNRATHSSEAHFKR